MSRTKRVYITRKLPSIAKNILSEYFDVEENDFDKALTKSELKDIVRSYDAIISTVSDDLNNDLLSNSSLEVISNYAVGFDNINISAAKENGITVYNTPNVVTDSCADHAFALLLTLVRKINSSFEFVKRGEWSEWSPYLFVGEELSGKTLGIIGYGRIGKAIGKRASCFDLKVIAYDKISTNDTIATMVSFDNLLENSDFISLNLPLNNKTKGFISYKEFEKMERKPYLINTSRGEIVDSDALLYAFENNMIKGAGLDVFHPEPITKNHPIFNYNCIITPHIGTATKSARSKMAKLAAKNVINHYYGVHNGRQGKATNLIQNF